MPAVLINGVRLTLSPQEASDVRFLRFLRTLDRRQLLRRRLKRSRVASMTRRRRRRPGLYPFPHARSPRARPMTRWRASGGVGGAPRCLAISALTSSQSRAHSHGMWLVAKVTAA